MNFRVVSRDEIEAGVLIKEPYIVISVRDPGRHKPRIFQPGHCRGLLYLAFHDAEVTHSHPLPQDLRPFRTADAEALWQFFDEHRPHIGCVLVHCEQGVSRSPAVAAALAQETGGNVPYFFRHFQPNLMVYQLLNRHRKAMSRMSTDNDSHVLADVLAPGLKVVFCGTAAGTRSAALKSYYAGRGNSFWSTLFAIGLTPRQLLPHEFKELITYSIGLTDLCKCEAGNDADLSATGFDIAGLTRKLELHRPNAIAFNGKKAAAEFYQCKTADLTYGRQANQIGPTTVYILPSTFGGARGFWNIQYWRDLAADLR